MSNPDSPDDVELPEALQQLFEFGRGDDPSPADLEQLKQGLTPQLAAPASGGVATKVALVVLAGLMVGGVSLLLRTPEEQSTQPLAPASSPTVPVNLVEPTAMEMVADDSALVPETPEPHDSALLVPETPEPPQDEARARPREDLLIDRAQRALARSPARSLRLLRRHGSLYPDGVLAQEREALAVRALVGLSRTPQARARVERFNARWPSSPHLPALRALVETEN